MGRASSRNGHALRFQGTSSLRVTDSFAAEGNEFVTAGGRNEALESAVAANPGIGGCRDRTTKDRAMQTNEAINPFALMTSPEAVFAALERSDRLARLKSTICRPLDKPRPEKPLVELRAFDEAIETADPFETSFG